MVDEAVKHRKAFLCLIKDINCFDFEDIKSIQHIFLQLYESETTRIESIMAESGNAIISKLLKVYGKRDISAFVGIYLRMFTNSIVSLFLLEFHLHTDPAAFDSQD